jgi:hypothetical protein
MVTSIADRGMIQRYNMNLYCTRRTSPVMILCVVKESADLAKEDIGIDDEDMAAICHMPYHTGTYYRTYSARQYQYEGV